MGALSDRLGKRKAFISLGYIIWGISIILFAFLDPRKPYNFVANSALLSGTMIIIMDCIMTGNHVYKSFDSKEKLLQKYEATITHDVINNIPRGLSAIVYTQLSDVEEELNGFVTFDREIVKIDPSLIKSINDKIGF